METRLAILLLALLTAASAVAADPSIGRPIYDDEGALIDAAYKLSESRRQEWNQRICPAYYSPRDEHLQQAAQTYADWMARHQNQGGHYGWNARVNWLAGKLGSHAYSEITAESWPWNRDATEDMLWADATDSWIQSPGHWRIACRKHWRVGAAMAQGRNGTYFFCLIACD